MATILGRSIGPWGVLAAVAGAAVLVPSAIALIFSLIAALAAVA